MTLYQRYARLPIRFSELGLERRSDKSSYFCTPRGSRVIGWAGVDGIHFCFVRKFGDMVFAVNPMAAAGEYVWPVARNFGDFLRLVLACGGTAAIEQAHGWSREQFDAFLAEEDNSYPPRADALETIRQRLELTAMPDPYGYLTALQAEFDRAAIPVSREARAEALCAEEGEMPWRVTWGGSLHGEHAGRRSGKELAVNAVFRWGEEEWHVPALYIFPEGIVADFCIGVDAQRVCDFLAEWEETAHAGADLTEEQRENAERANPLCVEFHASLTVDGRSLRSKSGSSTCWLPPSCGSGELTENDRRSEQIRQHYGLDQRKAWVFWRSDFPWTVRGGQKVGAVTLRLERDKQPVTVARFTDPGAGDVITFTHPISGVCHTLTVQEAERQTLDTKMFRDQTMEYPQHYVALRCALRPPLQDGALTLRDCAGGDQPCSKTGGAHAFGVIFGVGEPDAEDSTGQMQICAASAMYFAPPRSVTWRSVVHRKPMEDLEIKLR